MLEELFEVREERGYDTSVQSAFVDETDAIVLSLLPGLQDIT